MATLIGAAIGAAIGALVFLPFEIEIMPRWAEILVFAVVGALAGSAYAFLMSAGSGPHPTKEVDADAEQIITVSVAVDDGNQDELRRALSHSGAVRIDRVQVPGTDGRAHH